MRRVLRVVHLFFEQYQVVKQHNRSSDCRLMLSRLVARMCFRLNFVVKSRYIPSILQIPPQLSTGTLVRGNVPWKSPAISGQGILITLSILACVPGGDKLVNWTGMMSRDLLDIYFHRQPRASRQSSHSNERASRLFLQFTCKSLCPRRNLQTICLSAQRHMCLVQGDSRRHCSHGVQYFIRQWCKRCIY